MKAMITKFTREFTEQNKWKLTWNETKQLKIEKIIQASYHTVYYRNLKSVKWEGHREI